MEKLLDPRIYEKGFVDPTRKIIMAIEKLMGSGCFESKIAARMKPGDARTPRSYGLPKVHKEDCLLRPII